MLTVNTVGQFLEDLGSKSPAPGGGSVAALSGALGAALTEMVCRLTLGKKKYAGVESEIQDILVRAEILRRQMTELIEKDTHAFNKVMEAYGLPKENDAQKALRDAAIQSTTMEAALVPLEVMHHCIDGLALAKIVAEKGNTNSVSDAGVSAMMFYAAIEGAALNVRINLGGIKDTEFVMWKSDEVRSLLKTGKEKLDTVTSIMNGKIGGA